MTINEQIIVPVFNQLVQHKPRLALLLPEDGEEETDIRRLADEIINGFPWPIGVEFRRLFTPGCDGLSRRRLDQILKIVERSVQFISFVLLSQLLEESMDHELSLLNEHFRESFTSRFRTPTLGTYTWLIQSLGKIFETNAIDPFIPEMSTLTSKKFSAKLQPWTHIRNQISHYLINLDEEEIQRRCVDFQEDLINVFSDIAFFVKYPLVTITDIKVDKHKRKSATFTHAIKYLPNFAGKPQSYAAYTDSYAVLLLKSLKNAPQEYLNLSPLIIDTHTEHLDTPEKKKKIKMDIFLYSKYGKDRIHYVGTNVGDECDLRSLSCYARLVEEFNEYFSCFGGGE